MLLSQSERDYLNPAIDTSVSSQEIIAQVNALTHEPYQTELDRIELIMSSLISRCHTGIEIFGDIDSVSELISTPEGEEFYQQMMNSVERADRILSSIPTSTRTEFVRTAMASLRSALAV